MKKYNEGYALPFVLVVLVVMCVIVVGVMDFSMRNLHAQKMAIQRMEAKYEAAGKIEMLCASSGNAEQCSFAETDCLKFLVGPASAPYALLVASAGSNDSDVWVIAKFEPQGKVTDISEIFQEKNNNVLTINGNVKITEYKVVDRETALRYVEQETITPSTPTVPSNVESSDPSEIEGGGE